MFKKNTKKYWEKSPIFKIIKSGANNLTNNRDRIDALNVFPVPDGDTGSNMAATINYAIDELKKSPASTFESAQSVIKALAKGMLFGARGNSGVIFSQILKGFSVVIEKQNQLEPFAIVQGFKMGQEYAYKAVLKPVEGTILTVVKDISNSLANKVTYNTTNIEILELVVQEANKSVARTPDLLPILKEVGVVDSGGEGLVKFLEGILLAVKGNYVALSSLDSIEGDRYSFISNEEAFEGEFGYCTEFILELKRPKNFKRERFVEKLKVFGDSIVLINDEEIVKVHIHTKKPGSLLSFANRSGEFIKIKCDNMQIQANENKAAQMNDNFDTSKTSLIANPAKRATKQKIEIVAVASGEGIIDVFKKSGTSSIIDGGQSSNPSAREIADAIKSVKAKQVIVLTNNSNIVLAAQQASKTIKNKQVVVIPTRNVMQGITALYHFDHENDLQQNRREMTEAFKDVVTGAVTKCVRSTIIEKVKVKKDEFLGIVNSKIFHSHPSKIEAAISAIKKGMTRDAEILTIYYGSHATKSEAQEIADFFEKNNDLEINVANGGQSIYHFYFIIE